MKAKQIALTISPNDFTVIQSIAVAERRTTTDVIRNLLEDIAENRIEIEPEEPKEKHATAVRVSEALKEKVGVFQKRTGLSIDKAVHIALERTQPELFAAIDALGQKHRHSNSPRPAGMPAGRTANGEECRIAHRAQALPHK